jgi:hypothetical protein
MIHGKYGKRRTIPEEIEGNTIRLAIPQIYYKELPLEYILP